MDDFIIELEWSEDYKLMQKICRDIFNICPSLVTNQPRTDYFKKHFERNDAFFIFYAEVSMGCFYFWSYEGLWACLPIGFGIMAYGATYFIVHDIFIHQRFKMFRKANNWYAKGVRRAHKMHHKHLGKKDSECFGMLIVPFKYFKR